MKAVDQTTFGFPGGNCFSACVASLLEISLADVPYFMSETLDDDGGAWFDRFQAWLKPRGFWAVCFKLPDQWRPEGLCILSGKSPRELANPKALHSVVAIGGRVVHDPHPSRDGIRSQDDVVILIPLDPSKVAAPTPIEELIANSSIGAALADKKARGLEAHLEDLEREIDGLDICADCEESTALGTSDPHVCK